ncbi:hypothetical protein F66182_4261 [Fusarium sp. NRRL 66182]|nr:hypothetical protein F66182_4261 [Fusarium sp. NRRL 66182]
MCSATPFDIWNIYHSVPIQKTDIRLLKVLPAPASTDAIKVVLFKQDKKLSSSVDYDALSYRWGDANDRCCILVNDQDFWITRSLHSALEQLRTQDSEIILWVDSICIDQDNIQERNHQVFIMKSIYSAAFCVRVYIGGAGSDTESAMQLISDCDLMSDPEQVKDRILVDKEGSLALTKLLMRPYWQRMWIFQEIVLGQRVMVHCGSFEVPWRGLRRLDEASGDGRLWYENQVRQKWVLALRKALFRISHFCMKPAQARQPANVLLPTRTLQATDPRDKLFALLGVSDFGPTIYADYSKPVRQVYAGFASRYMMQNNELTLLLAAGLCQMQNGPDIDLPSWTPDFRGIKGVDIRSLAASYLNSFQAAGTREASFLFNAEGSLQSMSIIIDEIEKAVPIEKSEECRTSLHKSLREGISDDLRHSVYKHYFETLIFYDGQFEVTKDDGQALQDMKHERLKRLALGFAHEWVTLLSPHVDTLELLSDTKAFLDSFTAVGLHSLCYEYDTLLGDAEILQRYQQEYLIRSAETFGETYQAQVFLTKKGYVGKGPGILQKGDVVAVLYGCKLPLILRKVGIAFRLVGPCYVGGAMNGEIIAEFESESGQFSEGDIQLS